MLSRLARALPALVLLSAARPAAAQIDYRNLDDDRPVTTEDAYPVERHAFELLVPWKFEAEAGGERLHAVVPELAYGILPNTHVGVKTPFALVDDGGNGETGFSGLRLFALHNLNTETPGLPALSLRADLGLPVGALGGEGARVGLKAIATRSWGATRAHLNASWSVGDEDGAPAAAEPLDRWRASLAVDHTFLRRSLLLIGDLGLSEARRGAPTEATAALGVRWQWRPTFVLDAGLERRLRGGVGPDIGVTIGLSHAFALRPLVPSGRAPAPTVAPRPAGGALPRRDEQFYYPGGFNWQFLRRYPDAARLFNAFDYGHAVLYETLLTTRGEETTRRLAREYEYLTTDLLRRPPRFAVAEEAVEPDYAKLVWRAKLMFDWAHVLHRQIYDLYADPGLAPAERDTLIERATDYYLARTEYAFTPVPKSMALMDEQYFSQSFRRAHPAFNGLIWAYHWLQVGLYEPLLEAQTSAAPGTAARAGVAATLERFWAMVDGAPAALPRVMPMTSAVAPRFSAAHPRAAIVFDNLHMMHDIISDVLHSEAVPAERKAGEIARALDEFRDPTRNVTSLEMWRDMGEHMGGVDAMGGAPPGAPHRH